MKTKKYTIVKIFSKVDEKKNLKARVSKTMLNTLERLQHAGGFTRFDLMIIEQVNDYSHDHEFIKIFLKENNLV